jgi:hypothetical protein
MRTEKELLARGEGRAKSDEICKPRADLECERRRSSLPGEGEQRTTRSASREQTSNTNGEGPPCPGGRAKNDELCKPRMRTERAARERQSRTRRAEELAEAEKTSKLRSPKLKAPSVWSSPRQRRRPNSRAPLRFLAAERVERSAEVPAAARREAAVELQCGVALDWQEERRSPLWTWAQGGHRGAGPGTDERGWAFRPTGGARHSASPSGGVRPYGIGAQGRHRGAGG